MLQEMFNVASTWVQGLSDAEFAFWWFVAIVSLAITWVVAVECARLAWDTARSLLCEKYGLLVLPMMLIFALLGWWLAAGAVFAGCCLLRVLALGWLARSYRL